MHSTVFPHVFFYTCFIRYINIQLQHISIHIYFYKVPTTSLKPDTIQYTVFTYQCMCVCKTMCIETMSKKKTTRRHLIFSYRGYDGSNWTSITLILNECLLARLKSTRYQRYPTLWNDYVHLYTLFETSTYRDQFHVKMLLEFAVQNP